MCLNEKQLFCTKIKSKMYSLGIDIGSTTIKMVLVSIQPSSVSCQPKVLWTMYRRHNADITGTAVSMAKKLQEKMGDITFSLTLTGSVGMGYAQRMGWPFEQEVVAAVQAIEWQHPDVGVLIDMGGEDSKMVFFSKLRQPDMRMNGACAGGTGAFIDQTAALLNVETAELNELAAHAENIHPIASRCGVFSKTDIQNLLSRNVSKADIAASVFNAVALQVITTLARGKEIRPKLIFCGGPFAYLPELKKYFIRHLHLQEEDCLITEHTQYIPAIGCAISASRHQEKNITMEEFLHQLQNTTHGISDGMPHNLEPLFHPGEEYADWLRRKSEYAVMRAPLDSQKPTNFYLGVDSGSTTTKLVVINSDDAVVYSDYRRNAGDSFHTFCAMLQDFKDHLEHPENVHIAGSAVTGYGENLLKTAFNLNFGIVETIAHLSAAQKTVPDVSFVLDIGGQDMKAIFIRNGFVERVEINEACSSGCGSFIETYANTLGYSAAQFAQKAAFAPYPCDLGTRCTVFMNSKVKQMMSEGAAVEDIAAGFSYSVVKNCLFKVLKLKDIKELGDKIVVQGGTMKNHSVVRALELITGCEVHFTDIPELMGAYGAALYARQQNDSSPRCAISIEELLKVKSYTTRAERCQGCINHCAVQVFDFDNGRRFCSGNQCERFFSNRSESSYKGVNMFALRNKALFGRQGQQKASRCTIGIPRALGIYENYPFWHTLFTRCGFKVVLSQQSTPDLYNTGVHTIMSDNICYPAKLMHGHVFDLVRKGVNRIFYPFVVYEQPDGKASNSFNCPIVSGYSDVLRSAIDTAATYHIPMDSPTISFKDEKLLRRACTDYLGGLGVDKAIVDAAVTEALREQDSYKKNMMGTALNIFAEAIIENRMVILLAGRPYHSDPLIEHQIAEAICEMGVDVITEDVAAKAGEGVYEELNAVSQWSYPNRIFKAAYFVGKHNYPNLHFVQLTSFGCGPDAFFLDETTAILKQHGKNHTILKIDDVNNIGSLRLRVRSLVESARIAAKHDVVLPKSSPKNKVFEKEDARRTIIAPFFAEGYSEYLPSIFKLAGYRLVCLPVSTQRDAETGLKYANNDVCYPATVVVGSLMNALQSGEYDLDDTAVIVPQTGGQCRATNYLSLVKNALAAAGLERVPVLSMALGAGVGSNQPGFHINYKKLAGITINSLLYADCLMKLYHSAVVRERKSGTAISIRNEYMTRSFEYIERNDSKGLRKLLGKAVAEFTRCIDTNKKVPVFGLVGEIFVKYNRFSNKDCVNWLIRHGVEVVPPSLFSFFCTTLVNKHVNREQNIQRERIPLWITDSIHIVLHHIMKKYDEICSPYPFYHTFTDIFENAKMAQRVINLAADFGEGWMLPGEICDLAERGVRNIISLQPFGCIANHIISKGIEKKIHNIYPDVNMLFLDFDSGTSEANVYNRLHFLLGNK